MSTKEKNSEALKFIYQDTEIHNLFSDDDKVMVNATEMAKLFNKRTDFFMKSDHAKEFIKAIKLPPFGGSLGINSDSDLVDYQGRNGTYFHRVLALKFAAWLDPMFEVWIYSKIEEVLFGKAKNVTSKISEAEKKKLEISILTEKVKKLGNEDVNKLLLEIDELKKIENEKKKAVRQFSSQYKMF